MAWVIERDVLCCGLSHRLHPQYASAVGTPVTRRPPHSPRRAVFPHRVPRLYSLARKTEPLYKHPPLPNFSDTRTRYLHTLQGSRKLLPIEAATLTPSPVEPLECTDDGPVVEAVQRTRVAPNAVILVVPPQPPVESSKELPARQVAMLLNPCLDPPARRLQPLARGASFHPRYPLPVRHPIELKPQEAEPSLHARVKAAESQDTGLLRGNLETELRQPPRQHPIELFGIAAIAKGADKSSRPGESHPRALTEPYVNLSAHTALTVQPPPDAPTANAQRAPDHGARWHGSVAFDTSAPCDCYASSSSESSGVVATKPTPCLYTCLPSASLTRLLALSRFLMRT